MPLERYFEEFPHELVRMGADYDIQQGGRVWSLHLGAYRGGIYLLWDVRLVQPGNARLSSVTLIVSQILPFM
jgi:hypothetical protein